METVQFKTNIKCSGCIASVTPFLNEVAGEDNWEVDIQNPDKVLTVSTEKANNTDIKKAIEKAGYQAVELMK
jgi:copper chaperone